MKTIAAVTALLGAGILGAACSSETGSASSGGGDGGQSSASSSSQASTAQSSSAGQGGAGGGAGGEGGAGCGDTQTDPDNCGTCGNQCIPGMGCVAGGCECPVGAKATLSGDVQPILSQSCVKAQSCHGTTAAGKLNLSSGMAYLELVDVGSDCADKRKLVTPGKPEESYILNKLLGKGLCGGKKMPLNAATLSDAKITSIMSWICAGAQDN